MARRKVAMLTAGGLAPCLSAAVGGLIQRYSERDSEATLIGYLHGYQGVLKAQSIEVSPAARAGAGVLLRYGGSPLGNSRVKLTNAADCVKRGLVKAGENPLKVAADQLARDGVNVLHTIGGDDTSLTAADLASYLAHEGYDLKVVGLPKTIDNDIFPVRQSLGAWTAAEQGAMFFENVVNEGTTAPRVLLVHEVMGRHSGWLTAATAAAYRRRLADRAFLPELNLPIARQDLDAVYLPEAAIDLQAEAARLKKALASKDCVSVFVSEGAFLQDAAAEMERSGKPIERDAFGHVKLDKINVGEWLARRLGGMIGAERTLVQKSGYFARSAAPNDSDLALIARMVACAVESGLDGSAGLIGEDQENGDRLCAIPFERIRGGKEFDTGTDWFAAMLGDIGQPTGRRNEG